MSVKIDAKLNIVIPVDTPIGTLHVHSTPIDKDVFERYYLVIARTFGQIYGGGLGMLSGPRVAMLILKDIAKALDVLDGPDGVQNGLINEIKRRTNVAVPTDNGWEVMPYVEVIQRGLLSDEDIGEVENALAFFTVVSSMMKRKEREETVDGAASLWGARATLLNITEWMNSLKTVTAQENSSEKAAS